MIPLVSQHDTWVSLDSITGCPADCAYCFVRRYRKTGVRPVASVAPDKAVQGLIEYLQKASEFLKAKEIETLRIVCLGNYTDMFMSRDTRRYAIEYAQLHHQQLPKVPIVFVTKAVLDLETVDGLDNIGHPILVFVSQSFLTSYQTGDARYEKGVASPEESCNNLRLLAQSNHLIPLHFWRPLTYINLPNEAAAFEQISMIHEAGAIASVAVGLKYGRFLQKEFVGVNSPLRSLLVDCHEDMYSPLGEVFPLQLRDITLRVGREVGHPVYLNTSCAVSIALTIPEYLRTWRPPIRRVRCDPASCPDHQRARCLEQDQNRVPSRNLMDQLCDTLMVPKSGVDWDSSSETIVVNSTLTQELQCRLIHLTGFRLRPLVVQASREWIGTVAGVGLAMKQNGIQIELENSQVSAELARSIERLKRITGMLTPVGPPSDRRPSLFSRYFHVRRVAIVALGCAVRVEEAGGKVNMEHVRRLSWLHDLNRWPFAHNSEKGLYDQSASLPQYFHSKGIPISAHEIDELVGIHKNNVRNLSKEALLVLTADRATGMIEDILFAITALGLKPSLIPDRHASNIELPFDQQTYQDRLREICKMFQNHKMISEYKEVLDRMVTACALNLVAKYIRNWHEFDLDKGFQQCVVDAKSSLLIPLLYPIINNGVGHGEFIRERIVTPLLSRLGPDYVRVFTSMDDCEAVNLAVRYQLIHSNEVSHVYSDFAYIQHKQPNNYFCKEL